jgi:hypothetical protein
MSLFCSLVERLPGRLEVCSYSWVDLVRFRFSNGATRLIDLGLHFFGPLGGFLIELLLEALDRGLGFGIWSRSWIFATSSRRRGAAPWIAGRHRTG